MSANTGARRGQELSKERVGDTTQIKHKEMDTVFAFGCEKINIHYMGTQLRN